MSMLGSLVRVSPEDVDRLRSPDAQPYEVLSEHEAQIDLYKYWDVLRFLLDEAGVPVNPMRSGRLYPSEDRAWGGFDGDSCLLTADEVQQVAHFLESTPFPVLAAHLGAAAAAPIYGTRGLDDPFIQERVSHVYEQLRELFREAAANGDCTVFWAA